MPKIDIEGMEWKGGTGYPVLFQAGTRGRSRKRLGNVADLTQFGVNLCRLEPGSQTALRHWHENEDEFVFVLEGEVLLIEDDGETVMRPGDAAGFKAGIANGHHFVNRSSNPAILIEIGSRLPTERAHYPDDDLVATKTEKGFVFTAKDGTPY